MGGRNAPNPKIENRKPKLVSISDKRGVSDVPQLHLSKSLKAGGATNGGETTSTLHDRRSLLIQTETIPRLARGLPCLTSSARYHSVPRRPGSRALVVPVLGIDDRTTRIQVPSIVLRSSILDGEGVRRTLRRAQPTINSANDSVCVPVMQ